MDEVKPLSCLCIQRNSVANSLEPGQGQPAMEAGSYTAASQSSLINAGGGCEAESRAGKAWLQAAKPQTQTQTHEAGLEGIRPHRGYLLPA